MLKQLVSQMTWGPQHCCSFKQIEFFFQGLIFFFHDLLEEAIVAILNLSWGR